MIGKKYWVIADGFISDTESGEYVSHEAICVLNLSPKTANIEIVICFENCEPMTGISATCESMRTNNIRLDKIENVHGEKIPRNTPYAIYLKSNVPVVVQHSRMDVSDPNMTLMTTIAY